MSINHQIITLEDNNKYFVLDELVENNEEYCLLLNISAENDIKIMTKNQKNGKLLLEEVEDKNLLNNLSIKFKELLEKDQEMYS